MAGTKFQCGPGALNFFVKRDFFVVKHGLGAAYGIDLAADKI